VEGHSVLLGLLLQHCQSREDLGEMPCLGGKAKESKRKLGTSKDLGRGGGWTQDIDKLTKR
jgi:hypothetical protein